jgi:hypothetical protein
MSNAPDQLKNIDIATTDQVVRRTLQEQYLQHPTRGPYVTSRELYDVVAADIDDRFTRQLFGVFCERQTYLTQWSRGHKGASRYRILSQQLDTE